MTKTNVRGSDHAYLMVEALRIERTVNSAYTSVVVICSRFMINFRVTNERSSLVERTSKEREKKGEKRSNDVLSCSSRAHCQAASASIKINEKIS